MAKIKRLEMKPRRPSRIPATPGRWSKLIGIPATHFTSCWYDPIDLEIVVHAPVANAAVITDKPMYLRTVDDQLDDTMAYYIFNGQLVTGKETPCPTTPNCT